jgi:16S rRNA (guanine527-N7)-methyltransferase
MIDEKLTLWISEIVRYNKILHLVGPKILNDLKRDIGNCISLISYVIEPVIADLGSGSGIPGIAYALRHPSSKVMLIERAEKKCIFLRHVIACMGIHNVEVIEDDPLINKIGRFPAVISRAFSPKEKLSEAASLILENAGRFYYIASERPVLKDSFKYLDQERLFDQAGLKLFKYRFSTEIY